MRCAAQCLHECLVRRAQQRSAFVNRSSHEQALVLEEMKPARKTWPERWSQIKPQGKPLQLYLLLDAAQQRDLLAQLPQSGAEALFAFSRDSKEGQVSPWLAHLGAVARH